MIACYGSFGYGVSSSEIQNQRTRVIITLGLCIFYPILEGQKRFLRSFFKKILPFSFSRTVHDQEWVMMVCVP